MFIILIAYWEKESIRKTKSEKPRYIHWLDQKYKKVINKSTLLVGSSILKGVRTSELQPNATSTIRKFSGAKTEDVKTKIREYDIDRCKTIILHVGNGTDPEEFCDGYVSLLNSLVADDRRIIVSGLLSRQSVDFEPFNDKLKALCAENDIEYVDHFASFLLASGEMAEMYFLRDRTHLNGSGTTKFLSNIDKVFKVLGMANSVSRCQQSFPRNKQSQGFRNVVGLRQRNGLRTSSKNYHICSLSNHNTAECWFNDRNARQQRRFSR